MCICWDGDFTTQNLYNGALLEMVSQLGYSIKFSSSHDTLFGGSQDSIKFSSSHDMLFGGSQDLS